MKKGFTLVEALVSIGLVSLIITAIFSVLSIADLSWQTDTNLLELQQHVRMTMDSIAKEVRNSVPGTIYSSVPEYLTFYVYVKNPLDPYEYVQSPTPIMYTFDKAAKEIKRYNYGTTRVLAKDISNLSFSLSGEMLEIRINASKIVKGKVISYSMLDKVRLRNEE